MIDPTTNPLWRQFLPPPPPPPPAPELPLDWRVKLLEDKVKRLEVRTLLLAVIGGQTVLTLALFMIILSLVL